MDAIDWGALGAAVGAGELYLEADTARRCATQCDHFIAQLRDLLLRAQGLAKIDGFGTDLPSAIALTAKFEQKASGGDLSMDRVIAKHIDVVAGMRDVFLAIENRYAAAEEANTAAASAVESQIN